MSRFTIVLDPEDYNDRLSEATRRHAVRAAWLLIVLAALALAVFDFSTNDADATGCAQRLVAPEAHAVDPDSRSERVERLDWDREGYQRSGTGNPHGRPLPCSS